MAIDVENWFSAMNFDELLSEANNGLKNFLGDEKGEPISARTLRYWISKGVLDKRGTRGPKTTYPESFVWRVILTRQHQLLSSMTLDQIAAAQAELADDEVLAAVRSIRHKGLRASRPKQSDAKSLAASTSMSAAKSDDISSLPVVSELRDEIQKFEEVIARSLHSHETLMNRYAESLARAEERRHDEFGDHLQDALARMREEFKYSLAEMRDEFRCSLSDLHREFEHMQSGGMAAMENLAGSVSDLRQKIDELNSELMAARKSPSRNRGDN